MENCKTASDDDCDGATPPCAPGEIAWSRWFPVSSFPAYAYVFDARFDANDDLLVLFGLYSPGTLDLGLEPVTSGPCGNTLVVAKLDGKTGATLWQAPIVGVDADYGGSLAVQPGDSIALTIKRRSGCMTVVDGVPAPSDRSVLILDKGGHPQTFFALPAQLGITYLATRPGGLTLGGSFNGFADFGGGVTLTSAAGGSGFVAALDTAGHATWATALGLAVESLDTDATGTTYAAWLESGSILSSGSATLRVGAISAAGALGWSRAFAASNIQSFFGVYALRARAGTVAVGGALYADADLGFGAVTATGYNSFLVLLDTAGNTKFGKWLDAQGDYPYLDLDALGDLYLSAGWNGFGDRFWRLATSPQVSPVWSTHGGTGPVAADSVGDAVLARTDTTLDLAYVVEKHAR